MSPPVAARRAPRPAVARPFTIEPPPAWVKPIAAGDAAASEGDSQVSNGRRYLLLDRQERIDGAAKESYVHVIKRITNESGLSASSQISFDIDAGSERLAFHRVVIRRGGAVLDRLRPEQVRVFQREPNLEQQIFDGRRSLVLLVEDLRVGDVVEYAATIRGADPTLAGHFVESITLGTTEPIARFYARLLTPNNRKLRVAAHGPDAMGDPKIRIARDTLWTEHTWELAPSQAWTAESTMPVWYSPLPWVEVTDFGSWAEVAAWGMGLFAAPAAPSPELLTRARALRDESTSYEQIIQHAARLVQDEIRYVGIEVGVGRRRPTDPSVVLRRRFGDCKDKTMLLVALLGAAGVKAEPALVSSTLGEHLDERLPSPAAFDHVIAHVGPVAGKEYWIDSTATGQGGSLPLSPESPFARALVLRPGATGLTRIAEVKRARPLIQATDHFVLPPPDLDGGEAQLDVVREYRGPAADAMRGAVRAGSRDDLGKNYLRIYGARFPGIAAREPVQIDDARDGGTLRLTARFTFPSPWKWMEQAGRYQVLTGSPLLEEMLARPSVAGRISPLAITHPTWVRHDVEVSLPFTIPGPDEQRSADGPGFTFDFGSHRAANGIRYSYEYRSRKDAIEPEEFAAHLAALDRASAVVSRSVMFRPPKRGVNWWAWGALGLALPGYFVGARRAWRYRAHAPSAPPRFADYAAPIGSEEVAADSGATIGPAPIGGVLALVALRVYSAPFFIARELPTLFGWLFSAARWQSIADPMSSGAWSPLVAGLSLVEMLVQVGLLVYSVLVAVTFARKRRSFIVHFLLLTVGALVLALGDHLLMVTLAPQLAPVWKWDRFIGQCGLAALFNGYLWTTARARRTFVRA